MQFNSLLLFTLICITFGSCNIHNNPSFSTRIVDQQILSKNFEQEDQLRYLQQYENAILGYQKKLTSPAINKIDSLHGLNQLVFCQLMLNQMKGTHSIYLNQIDLLFTQVKSESSLPYADFYFNKSRYYFLQNNQDSALIFAHQALKNYYTFYPKNHLKTAYTLNLLALIHLEDGRMQDSISYYAIQANELFIQAPELTPYNWENGYIQSALKLMNRTHERGEYNCRAVLNKLDHLNIDNPWLKARCLNLLAKMIKKRADGLQGKNKVELYAQKTALYSNADSLFKHAINIRQQHKNADLIDFYSDWVVNAQRFRDTSHFFNAISEFRSKNIEHPLYNIYYHRPMGYYYYLIDHQKTIYHYSLFLANDKTKAKIHYRLIDEAYFSLTNTYKRLNRFDKALEFVEKEFVLFDKLPSGLDFRDSSIFRQLDSFDITCLTRCGFFANTLLEKYESQNKTPDLILASQYFDFIDHNFFTAISHIDEDAYLTTQLEVMNHIFLNAFKAAYYIWLQNKEEKWLGKALKYMEHTKAFLLYRDMLKEENSSNNTHSITDSIRIIQGQINQIIFSQNQSQKKEAYNEQLFNQLTSLQYRKKSKLANTKTQTQFQFSEIEDVRSKLKKNQAIVSYLSIRDNTFGIFLDQDTSFIFVQKDEDQKITNAIQSYRHSLETESRFDETIKENYLKASQELYSAFIVPIGSKLNTIEELVIIPDNRLDQIPFEAFLTEDVNSINANFRTLPYLLLKFQISYSPSLKIFAANQNRILKNFKDQKIGFWTIPDLATAEGLEILKSSVNNQFNGRFKLYNEEKGGKANFLQHHQKFDILHLLLHARSSKNNRLDNHIRFGESLDDMLFGFELSKHKINSPLIVLASCESASGTIYKGEGTFSLTRSFLNAGARQIISAQYLIPQSTSGFLLHHFYDYLADGLDASNSLHQAKLLYLQKIPKERHAFPRFWAGMVVYN